MRRGIFIAFVLAFSALLSTTAARGQMIGTCAEAKAEAYLDVNNVRARIFNNGTLFWKGSPHVYEVPKGGGISALFNSVIWIGGLVQNELRVAAARYGRWQFWPGPLDDDGNPPDHCLRYDRIYEITRNDLITYAQTGEPTPNLLDWPWHLGAPVIDGDGIEGNYDLAGGDRPALIGDQMLWWVMNDAGNEHRAPGSDTPPIGMEVHGTAFAFSRPRSHFDNTTFYRYVLHYKGQDPFEAAYFGLFVDVDLGEFSDDYVGSDTTLHLGFAYNGDNLDEGDWGYGEAPPAIGYTFLRTATDADGRDNNRDGRIDEEEEEQGMTAFMYFGDSGNSFGSPLNGRHHYNYLKAHWKNGQPVTVGGFGSGFSERPTHFMFPGDPASGAFWSERNVDGQGTSFAPGDRRFSLSTGPFTMQSGAVQEILFAIVWSRGDNHLDSVTQLKKDTARLQRFADDILVPNIDTRVPPTPEPSFPLGFTENYPNPFFGTTTIRYSLPQPMHVRLTVYDALGRMVETLVDARQAEGVYAVDFDGAGRSPGLYVYRIEMDHLSTTRQMLLLRL